MKFETWVNVVVRDKNGEVIERKRIKCKSYVRQLIDALCSHFSAIGQATVDTGGTGRTLGNSPPLNVNAGSGVTTHGVRAGTGTNAVAISDYALQTAIAEGTGAGQLSHGATSVGLPSTVGSSRQFTVARTFTNNSGASITVNEVAVYAYTVDVGSVTRYVCFERTLLTFSIANGASATVTYTIKVTV